MRKQKESFTTDPEQDAKIKTKKEKTIYFLIDFSVFIRTFCVRFGDLQQENCIKFRRLQITAGYFRERKKSAEEQISRVH